MKRLLYLTTALGAMMVLGTPGIQAEGPICPRWECGSRGSALDGHQVMLPDGLQISGTSAAVRWRSVTKRAALDNRQVEASDLPGVRSDPRRFPGDAWEVRPIDQRWPDASRDWLVEQ